VNGGGARPDRADGGAIGCWLPGGGDQAMTVSRCGDRAAVVSCAFTPSRFVHERSICTCSFG
jgi:hypothetical protein